MALLWAACYLLTAGNKHFSAAGKHNLILLFIVFSGEWFMYTFFHLLKEPDAPAVTELIPISSTFRQWIPPYVSAIYLLILVIRFLHYIFQFQKRNDLQNRIPVEPFIQSFADRFTRILGITKQVRVFLSTKTETAETCGFLKPLILLPVSLITRLSAAQVEAILVHELYHIRRNDYLINIIATSFRSLFFFNPFAQLLYKALERERELACDDGVLELGYEPSVYAEALFSLEKFRQANPGFSLAANGKKPWLLMERIRRVLGNPIMEEKGLNPKLLFGFAAALLFFGIQLLALPDHHRIVVAGESETPVHFEMAEEGHAPVTMSYDINPVHKKPVTLHTSRIIVKKKVKRVVTSTIFNGIPIEESGIQNENFFVDNTIVTNFSNESETAPVTVPVEAVPGSPYVPSASLIYQPYTENHSADSMQQKLMEVCLKDAETATRMHSIIVLRNLQSEINKSNKELKEFELKNKHLILLDQKNIQPVLNRINLEMKTRKKRIETLRNRLKISTEEIIHI
jgi:beta-lactamase regulating signal transducer with metallopeptidase domain